jgi:hypothetical protein
MSRILRRPMFRGGRVDSRGTGITSGLGYKQGGSVQARPGYFRGALVKGGLKYGKQGIDYLRNLLRGKPSTSKELVPSGYKFGDDFVSDFRKNLGVTGGLRDIPGVSPVLNYIARNPKKSIGAMGAFGLSDYTDMLPSGETIGRALLPGKIEDVVFGEEVVEDKKDDLASTINNLAAGNNLLNEDKNLKNQKKDPVNMEEQIDIDTETFAKALGKDKARIQDASDMALTFAGEAFKDDATVKSALGKFFEKEAGRKSRGTTIQDNAAALAINKYIKGEISRAEMNKLIELNRTKIADQLQMTKDATTFDDALAAGVKQNIGSSRKSIAVIDYAVNKILSDKGLSFGGELPTGEGAAEKISVGVVYVRDSEEKQGAKELITIDPNSKSLVVIKTIF